MSPIRAIAGRAAERLERHRSTAVLALAIALTTSGTAAAVSYVVLGGVNTAGTTTTIRSDVNGTVLQVSNFNAAGGPSARGINITVPAGRAPITVGTTAGKATNLNADLLDGSDAAAFARGTNVTVLANRLVLANGVISRNLLTLPGLGVIRGQCASGDPTTWITWENTTAGVIDLWRNNFPDGHMRAELAPATQNIVVGEWFVGDGYQKGDTIVLGYGNDPGARRTATVTLGAYRSAAGAPCGLQATATVWSAP